MSRLLAFFVLLGAAAPAAAQEGSPTRIHIGVYPVRIDDIDLKAGTASITYYIWTRWRGEEEAGTRYEIVNGDVDECGHEYRSTEAGLSYAYFRCRATVAVDFDFRRFPFDQHDLRLAIESSDSDVSLVRFVVDRNGLLHVPALQISGWETAAPRYSVVTNRYHTNWGIPGEPTDAVTEYSQFRMSIRLQHDVAATFLKTFLPLFIAVLIAFLGFFTGADPSARVGLGVAGIFGAVTSQAVVANNLPDIPYMTLSDRIHVTGMFVIFLVLVVSCLSGYYHRTGRTERGKRLDRLAPFVLGPGFALVVVLLILSR